MDILVPVKIVHDPELRIMVEGGAVVSKAGLILNPFDEYALETALRLTEQGYKGAKNGKVTVVTVGNPGITEKLLRKTLAMGADEAVIIPQDENALDGMAVARLLEAFVRSRSFDLVIMGKQSVEGDAGVVPAYLAGLLSWPQAISASSIVWDGLRLSVTMEGDDGSLTKDIVPPAVISVDLRIVAPSGVRVPESTEPYPDGPRYPSMKGQLRARRASIASVTPQELQVVVDKHVTYENHELFQQERKRLIVDDPAEFARILSEHIGGIR